MVKTKARLGYGGQWKGEGQARGSRMMDHCAGEVRVEGLLLMDQGDREERERLKLMDYEGHMEL
jgi:hypothetical protein